jgi:hypothetical protein
VYRPARMKKITTRTATMAAVIARVTLVRLTGGFAVEVKRLLLA